MVGRWRVVRRPWILWGCSSDGLQGLAAAGSAVPHGAACRTAVGLPGDILDKARRLDPEAVRAWSRRRQVPRQGGAAPPRRPLLDAALFIIVFLIY